MSVPDIFDLFVDKKPSFGLQDWAASFFCRIFFVENSKRVLFKFQNYSCCLELFKIKLRLP